MTTNKPLGRLLFAQGGKCFFCEQHLTPGEASVEHLVATANGGSNGDENCVACCKALNALLGRMSLKEKLRVVLNQKGHFKCPGPFVTAKLETESNSKIPAQPPDSDKLSLVIADLRRRGAARPRTVKTLSSTISALFQKKITESEVASLIGKLKNKGVVLITGTKVSYELPASSA